MAAINLKGSESLECTPMTSRLVQSEFEKQMEWTPGQGIEEDNEDSKEEEESEKEAKSLIAHIMKQWTIYQCKLRSEMLVR